MSASEPRNPFYTLLLAVSFLFVITALAWTIVPLIEDKARAEGKPLEPSDLRTALRVHGGTALLAELAAMIVLGLLSMGLDRLRRLQKERSAPTISPTDNPAPPPSSA
jgi:hypothetical protein